MDGLVLLLAVILNPRAERGAQCGELRSRDGAHDEPADGGTAIAAVVGPAQTNEKSPMEDRVTDVPAMDLAPPYGGHYHLCDGN